MRPLQSLLVLSSSMLLLMLVLYVTLGPPRGDASEQRAASRGHVNAFFSFTSPGSLFPPSAIISLTDDNSTFFLARPAAFGPPLSNNGLSAPLWIGSGFGDSASERGGELGCSDVPAMDTASHRLKGKVRPSTPNGGKSTDRLRSEGSTQAEAHLHADIHLIQESAEITGKVVLLRRGSCGFLAKVQWAQRRGGVAVIVGDDVRGGTLVRMYAQGDTSNITIPSIFTSHTTAHLLSSLLPPETTAWGSAPDDTELENNAHDSRFQTTSSLRQPQSTHASDQENRHVLSPIRDDFDGTSERPGFLPSLLSAFGLLNRREPLPIAGSRRLPTSGDLEWLDLADRDADEIPIKTRPSPSRATFMPVSDGFIIGEQDWRDPDVLPTLIRSTGSSATISPAPSNTDGAGHLPGSGEYIHTPAAQVNHKTWWQRWLEADAIPIHAKLWQRTPTRQGVTLRSDSDREISKPSSYSLEPHKGLWVTLTPTNVSTSPFFDTLLVLVVSPLVTLTVVYALLLLRSRIRRRRWRAPKSVVERLPVRTYQTIGEVSSSATPNASSPTTPLLQQSPTHSISSASQSHIPVEPDVTIRPRVAQPAGGDHEQLGRGSGLAAWRRRYVGRQRECVVCLEEYEDGVSQVMSLPCGHEYHADCMYVVVAHADLLKLTHSAHRGL